MTFLASSSRHEAVFLANIIKHCKAVQLLNVLPNALISLHRGTIQTLTASVVVSSRPPNAGGGSCGGDFTPTCLSLEPKAATNTRGGEQDFSAST